MERQVGRAAVAPAVSSTCFFPTVFISVLRPRMFASIDVIARQCHWSGVRLHATAENADEQLPLALVAKAQEQIAGSCGASFGQGGAFVRTVRRRGSATPAAGAVRLRRRQRVGGDVKPRRSKRLQ